MSAGKFKANLISKLELAKASSVIAMVAACAGIIVAFTDPSGILPSNPKHAVQAEVDTRVAASIRDIRLQLVNLRRQQEAIVRGSADGSANVQASTTLARLDAIEARQARLEEAILTTPEKALSMPLLRRDLEATREANSQALTALKANVDQVYDLTKWFIGALAVGIFSLAIPNLLSLRKSEGAAPS